jgi:hypothetical protein
VGIVTASSNSYYVTITKVKRIVWVKKLYTGYIAALQKKKLYDGGEVLKGLSHEIDFKNCDKNLQNLA